MLESTIRNPKIHNAGQTVLQGPTALDPILQTQPILWLHDLCLKDLTEHATELCLFGAKESPPPHPLLILLMSRIWYSSSRHKFLQRLDAMTRFGPSIEPITFPTPSRCATCYATDAAGTTQPTNLESRYFPLPQPTSTIIP